jgi:hypothetical protein
MSFNTTSLSGFQRPVVIFPKGHAVISRIQSTSQCLASLHTIEAFMQRFCISKTATKWKIIVQLLSFLQEQDYGLCDVCVCVCVCVFYDVVVVGIIQFFTLSQSNPAHKNFTN